MTWKNVELSCQLCEMNKVTKWYRETDQFVVAEKLGGAGPFIVVKNHIEEISDKELEEAHNIVEDEFGDHEFRVLMGIVRDHWHAHILTNEQDVDLSDE